MGYASLHALEEAGGLDALYVEPGVSSASSTSDTGTPVTISASQGSTEHASAIDARLYTINWDDNSALALIFAGAAAESAAVAAAIVDEADHIRERAELVKRHGCCIAACWRRRWKRAKSSQLVRQQGFAYFQGYFFRKPEILSSRNMPANRVNYLRMFRKFRIPNSMSQPSRN